MTSPVVTVVGTDATMVYDALHNVVANALGDLDPSFALQDFTAKDVTSTGGESIVARVMEALNTPALLVDRRVVVVRDAQQLLVSEVDELLRWMGDPSPATVLVLGVVGTKANKLVRASSEVIEVNVGSRPPDRVAFVESKLADYHVKVDHATAMHIAEQVGDDVARVDALARTLHAIYGSAPLNAPHVDPYLGDAGDVPPWDLTDAIDRGDAAGAIVTARRMLDSKSRLGLQIVSMLQRHYLAMTRLEGTGITSREDAGLFLSMNPFRAASVLRAASQLGGERIATAVHWITQADLDLKGGVSYGGKDLDTDLDVTDLTVIEVLVARLAKLAQGARRR